MPKVVFEQGLFSCPPTLSIPALESSATSVYGFSLTSAGLASALCTYTSVSVTLLAVYISVLCIYFPSYPPLQCIRQESSSTMPISFGFFPVHVWLCTFPLKLRLGFSVILRCCSSSAQMKGLPPACMGVDPEQGCVFFWVSCPTAEIAWVFILWQAKNRKSCVFFPRKSGGFRDSADAFPPGQA